MNLKESLLAILPLKTLILIVFAFFNNPDFILNNIVIIGLGLAIYCGLRIYWLRRAVRLASPIVGFPNQEKIASLALLFKIRCTEIKQVYNTIRCYQRVAADQNCDWIILFLENELATESIYEYRALSEKQKKEIHALYEEKFEGNGFDGSFDGEVGLAAALYCANPEIIYQLKTIAPLNVFQSTVSFLIQEYESFYDLGYNKFFLQSGFFNYFLRPKILLHYVSIQLAWSDIIQALRGSLAFNKQKNGAHSAQEAKLLTEIDALNELIDNLKYVIKQENSNGLAWTPDPEKEKIIMDLDDNDLVYNPYK